MGLFSRWMKLRESTSRKRAITAALKGERPPLPGSCAANPRTNVDAMKVADKTGVVGKKYMKKCACAKCGDSCPCGPECPCNQYKEDAQSPDYSLDRWIDMANDLGSDVSSLHQKSKEDEEKMDKEIDTKKKDVDKKEKEVKKADDKKSTEDKTKQNPKKDSSNKEPNAAEEERDLWKKFEKFVKNDDKKGSSGKPVKKPATSS